MSTTTPGSDDAVPPGLTLGPVRKPEPEPAVPPQRTADDDRTVTLGGKPAPDADHTVRLGGRPAPENPDRTVTLGGKTPPPDTTVTLGTAPAPADPESTVKLGGPKPAVDLESTVRLGAAAVAADPESTVKLGPAVPQAGPESAVKLAGPKPAVDPESTVRLGAAAVAADPESTVKLGPAVPQAGPESAVKLAGPKPAADPESTVKLGGPTAVVGPESTVRLGGAPVDPEATVKLPPAGGGGDASEAGTVRIDPAGVAAVAAAAAVPAAGFESATHLDPEVWTTPVAQPAPAEQELQRFGPGVPPLAAAAWHGTDAQPLPEEPKRRRSRWLVLPLVLLLGVAGWLGWERYGKPVAVVGTEVRTDDAGPGCDGTAVITGTLETDGGQGVVTYRWVRSDGTDSGTLRQQVPAGRHRTDVVLRWTFQGQGEMQATATLEVLNPSASSAATTFTYSCR